MIDPGGFWGGIVRGPPGVLGFASFLFRQGSPQERPAVAANVQVAVQNLLRDEAAGMEIGADDLECCDEARVAAKNVAPRLPPALPWLGRP